MSFLGGGTDFPEFFLKHGGAVLFTTIDKYCYVMLRDLPPFFDHTFRIRYTEREETQDIQSIVNPVARECLKYKGVQHGVEIIHTADIPHNSGVGSSSAFTVALLNAISSYEDKELLAQDAIRVERYCIGDAVGLQDQYACAIGGTNLLEFSYRGVKVTPIDGGDIERNILLFFTGLSRISSNIQAAHVRNIEANERQLCRMRDIVYEAITDVGKIGELLHESWMLKRSLTDVVSTHRIDAIYDRALAAGAVGGKLLGAGGSGCMLFWVEPERQEAVKAELSEFVHIPIKFEKEGAKILFSS